MKRKKLKKNQKKRKNNLKFYLKEIAVSLLLVNKIKIKQVKDFIKELVNEINMDLVFLKEVKLLPGFDVVGILKQSHVSFSYYPEYDFVRMFICSCKNFNVNKVKKIIKEYFNIMEIKIDIINNKPITYWD